MMLPRLGLPPVSSCTPPYYSCLPIYLTYPPHARTSSVACGVPWTFGDIHTLPPHARVPSPIPISSNSCPFASRSFELLRSFRPTTSLSLTIPRPQSLAYATPAPELSPSHNQPPDPRNPQMYLHMHVPIYTHDPARASQYPPVVVVVVAPARYRCRHVSLRSEAREIHSPPRRDIAAASFLTGYAFGRASSTCLACSTTDVFTDCADVKVIALEAIYDGARLFSTF
ncbi:hypothetical protein VTO73DRAFT_10800 [Trametes versicolor]